MISEWEILIPIFLFLGTTIIFVTAFLSKAGVSKAKAESISQENLEQIIAELSEIKTSLATVEKMMKDID